MFLRVSVYSKLKSKGNWRRIKKLNGFFFFFSAKQSQQKNIRNIIEFWLFINMKRGSQYSKRVGIYCKTNDLHWFVQFENLSTFVKKNAEMKSKEWILVNSHISISLYQGWQPSIGSPRSRSSKRGILRRVHVRKSELFVRSVPWHQEGLAPHIYIYAICTSYQKRNR